MPDRPSPLNPKLTGEQKRVLFEKGTEMPFSGKFLFNKQSGEYVCANCGSGLFKSEHKYDSRTPGLEGWPSFADVVKSGAVKLLEDKSYGLNRTEVVCARCDGHLGHVFDDDESPTGKHYCINSACLDFKPADK